MTYLENVQRLNDQKKTALVRKHLAEEVFGYFLKANESSRFRKNLPFIAQSGDNPDDFTFTFDAHSLVTVVAAATKGSTGDLGRIVAELRYTCDIRRVFREERDESYNVVLKRLAVVLNDHAGLFSRSAQRRYRITEVKKY
ncbi:MAG: hypothetical protein Q7R56_01445, partial [Nanoarchaeota archaeon]|nr:hypothetical protein [Nanoarchaeota archaeon]